MSRSTSTASIALAVAIVLALGFNIVVLETSPPIYSSHIIMFVFCTLIYLKAMISMALDTKPIRADLDSFVLFSMLAIYALAGFLMAPPRFLPEVVKFVFTLFTTYALVLFFRNYKISVPKMALAIVVGTSIASASFMANYNILEVIPSNRLDATNLGGFNVFGFIVANSLLASLYLLNITHSMLARITICSLIPLTGLALLLTFSRNAMLVFVIGSMSFLMLTGQKKLLFGLLLVLVAAGAYVILTYSEEIDLVDAIISRYFAEDLLSGSGSGRAEIWGNLLSDLLKSPFNLLFGLGLGSIQTEVTGGSTTVNAAHNQFLEYWFSMGFFGLMCMLYVGWRVVSILLRLPRSMEKAFFVAASIQIIFALFFDSHLQASQANWFFGLWFAVIVGNESRGGGLLAHHLSIENRDAIQSHAAR